MRFLFTAIALFITMNIYAQQTFETSKDRENGSTVYKGNLTYRDLEYGMDWFKKGFDAYTPNAEAQAYLQEHLKDYRLVIFLGTWCEDSQNLIPKLFKVFINIFFTGDKYETYGVDRDKKALHGEEKKYKVSLVPTIIVFDGDKEIGRIVENVNKSVEEDLATIIQNYEKSK